MPKHVDYLKTFANNLLPVIPAEAQLSPKPRIPPSNVGKVPGIRRSHGWVGIRWRELGKITLARARSWDVMGAAIGVRLGDMGTGYWVVPVGPPDAMIAGALTFSISASFDAGDAPGLHELQFVAIDASGNGGDQFDLQVCIDSRTAPLSSRS